MSFERIAGLFRRGSREDKEPAASDPANATRHALPLADDVRDEERDRERRDLAGTLDRGIAQVAGAMDRLNQHLRQNGELMTSLQDAHTQLPALIQAQQKIAGLVANAERGNQAVVQTLSGFLKQRDEAQQSMVKLLGQLNTAVIDQRTAHQEQLRMVLRLQGSQRRVLIALLLAFMFATVLLMGLVLALAIWPDQLKALRPHASPPPAEAAPHTSAAPATSSTTAAPIVAAPAPVAPAPAVAAPLVPQPAPAAPAGGLSVDRIP